MNEQDVQKLFSPFGPSRRLPNHGDQTARCHELMQTSGKLLREILDYCPPSRERDRAMTAIDDALTQSIEAIARNEQWTVEPKEVLRSPDVDGDGKQAEDGLRARVRERARSSADMLDAAHKAIEHKYAGEPLGAAGNFAATTTANMPQAGYARGGPVKNPAITTTYR